MAWTVEHHDEFDLEFDDLPELVRDKFLEIEVVLNKFGPQLSRPYVDTLNGSKHANMKEIILKIDGDA